MNLNNISSQCIQNRITLLHNQHKCINDLFYILFLFFVLSPRNPMSAFAHLHLSGSTSSTGGQAFSDKQSLSKRPV